MKRSAPKAAYNIASELRGINLLMAIFYRFCTYVHKKKAISFSLSDPALMSPAPI